MRRQIQRDDVHFAPPPERPFFIAGHLFRNPENPVGNLESADTFFVVNLYDISVFCGSDLGVIIHPGRCHLNHPGFQIKVFHQQRFPPVQINRSGVCFSEDPQAVYFAPVIPRMTVNDRKTVATAPEINIPVGDLAVRIEPLTVGALQQPGLLNQFFDCLFDGPVSQVGFRFDERRFSRGAFHMFYEDIRVFRVDHGGFRFLIQKNIRIAHKVLVKSVFTSDNHHRRRLAATTYPSTPLPGGNYGARIPHQDAKIQIAYVYAEFQRAG